MKIPENSLAIEQGQRLQRIFNAIKDLGSIPGEEEEFTAFLLGLISLAIRNHEPLEARARDLNVSVLKLVESALRGAAAAPPVLDPILTVGPITLDISAHSCHRATPDGIRPVDLTPSEFELLVILMRHVGAVVSNDDIAQHVWDSTHDRYDSIKTLVCRLRSKVLELRIEAVRTKGYRLEQPPVNDAA